MVLTTAADNCVITHTKLYGAVGNPFRYIQLQKQQANFKKTVNPLTCVWCIVCDSINQPGDL